MKQTQPYVPTFIKAALVLAENIFWKISYQFQEFGPTEMVFKLTENNF